MNSAVMEAIRKRYQGEAPAAVGDLVTDDETDSEMEGQDSGEDDKSPYQGVSRDGTVPAAATPGVAGTPAAAPAAGDFSNDPTMKRFEEDQAQQIAVQQLRNKAQGETNFIQAISQAAQGTNAPTSNADIFKNIDSNNDALAKGLSDQVGAREKVIEAIAKRKQAEALAGATRGLKEQAIGLQSGRLDEEKRYHDAMIGAQDRRTQAISGNQDNRLDQYAHRQVVNKLKGDPVTSQRLTQYSNLDNAINNLMSNPITPEAIHEFQQTVRSNMGIKGGGGVGEREQTYMNSLGLKYDRWKEMMTGNPADIAKNDKMVEHFVNMARSEQANIQAQKDRRIQAIAGGYGSMYKRRPDLKQDLDDLVGGIQDQFKSSQSAPTSEAPSAKDQAALQWLQANPNDPAAPKVKAKLAAKGLL